MFLFLMLRRHPRPTLFPYTTLFRSQRRLLDLAPIERQRATGVEPAAGRHVRSVRRLALEDRALGTQARARSEEHTSELQSQFHLVCRLLLEKKKKHILIDITTNRIK